jgi:hypothetical protein
MLTDQSSAAAPAGANSRLTLSVNRTQFEHLLGELNAAACIVGTVREALINSSGYEGGAVQRALEMVETVVSDLDAAARGV